MARRYIGRAIVTVVRRGCLEPFSPGVVFGYYDCTVAADGVRWTGRVYPPAAGYGTGVAYDSPKAYDSVANAAASFASAPDSRAWREWGRTANRSKCGRMPCRASTRRLAEALGAGGLAPTSGRWNVRRKAHVE